MRGTHDEIVEPSNGVGLCPHSHSPGLREPVVAALEEFLPVEVPVETVAPLNDPERVQLAGSQGDPDAGQGLASAIAHVVDAAATSYPVSFQ